jgi:hypothetical protein
MEQELAAQGGLDKLSPQQKEELMKTVQTQVALANMQELLTVRYKTSINCSWTQIRVAIRIPSNY